MGSKTYMDILRRRHGFFVLFILLSAALFRRILSALLSYSLHNQAGSQIILIPFVTIVLLYSERRRIFANTQNSIRAGAAFTGVGLSLYWIAQRYEVADHQSLSGAVLSIILIWIGGFVTCYGSRAARAAAFPLFFLLLIVPLPDALLDRIIRVMQQGSADIAVWIFGLARVPVLRNGFILSVPGFTIEIAVECSGIRSTIALFITSILAVRFLLRTPWKALLFMALTIPVAVIKNGIRVATLTLLSIYVNPGFLFGRLHTEGGIVFFLLALAILAPVLLFLQRSERQPASELASNRHDKPAIAFGDR